MIYKRNSVTRINVDLLNLRKTHRNALRKALGGMNIHEVDIDKIYARKLSNINILEEFFNGKKG